MHLVSTMRKQKYTEIKPFVVWLKRITCNFQHYMIMYTHIYIYIYIHTALQIDTPLLVTMNTMNRKINHQSNLIFGGHNKTKKKQKKTSLRIFSMSISNSVLVQMLSLHKCICSISCLVKKCMNFDRACKFFNKKTLKKATCL